MSDAAPSPRRRRRRRWAQLLPLQVALYLGLRLVVAFANAIPARAVPLAGRLLGRAIRLVGRKPARTARRNLELSRGIVEPAGVPAFLERVYANLGARIIDILRTPRAVARGTLMQGTRLDNIQVFDRCLAGGKGLIVAIGHLGNYETGGVIVGAAGYTLNSLARPIPNRFIDRYVTGIRTRTGCRIIPSDRAAREMLRVLARNELLVIEIDIDAKDDGVLVDFCGRPAAMHVAPARLAIKRGAPIVLVDCFRGPDGVDVIRFQEPLSPAGYRDTAEGVEALTRELARRFDERVREHPDQWLWLLDRWRGAERRLERERAAQAAPGAVAP